MIRTRDLVETAWRRRCEPQHDLDDLRWVDEIGDIIGVRVLDHVVVGQGRYVSFVDDGYW